MHYITRCLLVIYRELAIIIFLNLSSAFLGLAEKIHPPPLLKILDAGSLEFGLYFIYLTSSDGFDDSILLVLEHAELFAGGVGENVRYIASGLRRRMGADSGQPPLATVDDLADHVVDWQALVPDVIH